MPRSVRSYRWLRALRSGRAAPITECIIGSVARQDRPDGTPPPQLWDAVAGSDGVGYLIEAVPAGTFHRAWTADAPAADPDGIGVLLALVSVPVVGVVNLFGRAVHGFKWDLRVSCQRSQWPYLRKTVRRERFASKAEALKALPALTREVSATGP